MATKRRKLRDHTILNDWILGVIHWVDPTFTDEATDSEVATSVSVSEELANQFTFGLWKRDENGDYVIYSSVCLIDSTIQFDQRTLIPKSLVQRATDFQKE